MSSAAFLRRLLIPTSGCAALSVVYAKAKEEPPPPTCDTKRRMVRACDLPLYAEEKTCIKCTPKDQEEYSLLHDTIRCARQELWVFIEQAQIATNEVKKCYQDIRKDAESALTFLREESNLVPRIGAIAIGGLTGFVLGLRKGPITRFLYTATGATAMAALCYPNEAREYTQEGVRLGKKYVIISYHFLNGVSRDLTGYQLSPLPSGHLVISDGHHHDPADVVPSSAQLLPPTANATHIPMPHEERLDELKRHRDQIHPDEKGQ